MEHKKLFLQWQEFCSKTETWGVRQGYEGTAGAPTHTEPIYRKTKNKKNKAG